jgi:leucyl aminopeptidase (aminopeptidase T)
MIQTAMIATERTPQRNFDQKLDLLAEVAVKVGLGLKAGQELVMTASLDTVPLARRITEHAYRAGASLVTTLYTDDEATLARYHFATNESFDHAAGWLYDGMGESRGLEGVSACARTDHAARNQLDDRGCRDSGVGCGNVSQRFARWVDWKAMGGDFRHDAHQCGRPGERVEKA